MPEEEKSLPGQVDDGVRPEAYLRAAAQNDKLAAAGRAVKQGKGSLMRLAQICAGGTAISALARPVMAQVESEATQRPQPRGQPVHLEVAVHGLPPDAAGLPAGSIDPRRQISDGLLEGAGDPGEVQIVPADQVRVVLGGMLGEVEGTGGPGVHVVGSVPVPVRRVGLRSAIVRPGRGLAASPRVPYTLGVEGSRAPFLSFVPVPLL